uniref:beta strand repeat-containing protein n=1 Tax=Algoriphagus sp. TaxID=1872435 RepID=UPI0040488821
MINPQGGTAPYTYSWETRATAADPWQTLVLNGSTINPNSRRIVGAPPADYRVTVTDQSTPALQGSGIYTLSPPISLTATTHFEGLICSSEPNSGLALLEFDNGFPDYIWELVQGTTIIQQGTTDEFAIAIENLAVGTYTFNWTDDNDCTGTKTVTIAEPPSPLTATFTSQNVTCPAGTDGSITVSSISGGWGATYLIRIFRNGVQYRPWGPAQTNYTNLPAGTYTIEYTDKVNPANGYPFNLFTFSINQFTGCYKSASITITEPAPFSVPVTQSPAVCQGETDGFLSLIPTGGSPPYQVTFYSGHFDDVLSPVVDPNDMATVGQETGVISGQTVTQNGLAAGQYAIQLIDVNGCIYSGNFTLIENPKGQVNATADNAYCAGSPVSIAFTTTNSGGATTYDWVNTNPAIGLPASGQGDISFTSTNTTNAPIQGQITVTPTYTANGVSCVGPSDTFIVTVNPKPVIQDYTPAICSGDPFTVTPTNGGATIVPANTTYTWTVAPNANVSGQTNEAKPQNSISQTLINSTNEVQTVTYTVTPTSGDAGNCLGQTFEVVVTVNPKPRITSEIIPICSNAPIAFTATNGGINNNIVPTNTQYTWVIKTDNAAITGQIDEATPQSSFTQTLRNTTNTQKSIVYTITPISGSCTGTAFDLTVLVNPTPEFTDKTDPICSGGTFTITPSNAGNGALDIVPAGTTYTWTVVDNANVTGESNQSSGLGSISQTLTNLSNEVQTVTYTVTPTSGSDGNCVGQTFDVVVTVNPQPIVADETIAACSNAPISYTATNGGGITNNNIVPTNTQYTWTIKTDNLNLTGQSAQSAAQSNFTQTLRNSTPVQQTIIYTLTPISGTCTGNDFDLTVQVNPIPEIDDETIATCSNAPISYTATNGGGINNNNIVPADTQYTWIIKTDNNDIGGQSIQATPQSSFTQTLQNTTNTQKSIVYTLTPISGTCAGTPFDLTVEVNPTPEIAPKTATICSDDIFTVSPSNGFVNSNLAVDLVPAGTTYTWTVVPNANVTGESNEATPQANISQTLTNTSNVVQTVTYTVTPTSGATGSCTGQDFQVVVTVNPKPSITNPGSRNVCSNSSLIYVPASGPGNSIPAGTKYTWTIVADNPEIIGQTPQSTPQFLLTQNLRNKTAVPQSILYELTPISGTCTGATFLLSVQVNPTPEIADKTDEICSEGTFSVTPTNTVVGGVGDIVPTGTTYTWTVVDNPDVTGDEDEATPQNSISQQLTNTSNRVQTVVYTVTPQSGDAGNCFGQTFEVSVQVNPKPAIQAIPETVCSGSPFTITPADGNGNIVPTGTTYSWTFVDNPNVTGEANGTDATNLTQTLTNTTTSPEIVTYTVIPKSGDTGNCIGSPFTVTITVNPNIQITNKTPAAICSLSAFTVQPTDGVDGDLVPNGMQYTWTVGANPNIEGASNETTPQSSISQTLRNTTTSAQTIVYTVTPIYGASCSGGTFSITVTVNPTPEIENETAIICSGDAFLVTPTDGNGNIVPTGTRYSWTVQDNPSVTGENIGTLQPSISQFLTNTSNTVQTVIYTVTPISGAAGSCPGPTFNVTVTVNPRPSILNQSIAACSNAPISHTATNGANNIVPTNTQYTWVIKTDNNDITGKSAQATPQASFTQTLRNTTNTQQTIVYTLTPSSGSCAGNPFDLTIQVNPIPEIADKTVAICSEVFFVVSPVDGFVNGNGAVDIVPAGTTYTWVVTPNNNVTGESSVSIAQNSISQQLTNTTNTVQTVLYTVTPRSGATGNCIGLPFQVSVQVDPKPFVQTINETVCSDSPFTISPANGNGNIVPAGTTYTWTFVDNPDVTGEATGTAAANFTQTLSNTTTSPQTVTYTVTPTSGDSGNCQGDPFTINITVNPTPVIADITDAICSNSSFSVTPQDGGANIVPAGTRYSWTVTPNANVEGESDQTTAQPLISQFLRNTTNTVQTVLYQVTPTLGNCTGATFQVAITVNPTPEIDNDTAIICSGDPFSVTPINGGNNIVPTGTTYTWTVAPNANVTGQSDVNVGQNAISQTLTNTSNTVQTVIYTVTPISGAAGSCTGQTFNVTVTVNPRPSIVNETIEACSNAPINYTATHGDNNNIVPTNTQYTWVIKTDNNDITGKSA